MRVITWNMRRASARSPAWDYLKDLDPDVVLLQEVAGHPEWLVDEYAVASGFAVRKSGAPQAFSNVLACRVSTLDGFELTSDLEWVNRERTNFGGNILARTARIGSTQIGIVNVHSPAWPVPAVRLSGIDWADVKLQQNPDLWCTEILWKLLVDSPNARNQALVVGGDFNSSETFDYLWKDGSRGNLEIIHRMNALGLADALRGKAERLVPTFRNPKGGKVVHQIDHLYLSADLWRSCLSCEVGSSEIVFGQGLSDHLPIVAEIAI